MLSSELRSLLSYATGSTFLRLYGLVLLGAVLLDADVGPGPIRPLVYGLGPRVLAGVLNAVFTVADLVGVVAILRKVALEARPDTTGPVETTTQQS
ncbi:hypothetical protein [Haloarcula sp. JP-L23]|uniref:hypothetical protein n=1 Tax=Haloarcula sp. JP-L23 TaxID=2716717 RepID=UPI00140F35BE|nr:hypothetical protein G9465_15605 [Haloarcula sp. JP-L23]